ncbi:hypothetical protein BDW22DRAFT_1343331 [Trametopsis cervina]|nr:hypothetical protein BDW22DRAFT_1343331 [Trametopsis cervina]
MGSPHITWVSTANAALHLKTINGGSQDIDGVLNHKELGHGQLQRPPCQLALFVHLRKKAALEWHWRRQQHTTEVPAYQAHARSQPAQHHYTYRIENFSELMPLETQRKVFMQRALLPRCCTVRAVCSYHSSCRQARSQSVIANSPEGARQLVVEIEAGGSNLAFYKAIGFVVQGETLVEGEKKMSMTVPMWTLSKVLA